jgi:hypothetical protein
MFNVLVNTATELPHDLNHTAILLKITRLECAESLNIQSESNTVRALTHPT